MKTHLKNRLGNKTHKSPEQIITEIIVQLFENKKNCIIAIGGPGGTGKSTFAQLLSKKLVESTVLSLDDYKTDRKIRKKQNIFGPHPDANKIDEIKRHLTNIKTGTSFKKPLYCRETGSSRNSEIFIPTKYNIVDGEVATYKDFRDLVDFSIFVDSDWETQLNTRISRDIKKRNYSEEKAIETFLQSNIREFRKYGAGSKNWADIHIYCHDNYQLMIESVSTEIFHIFEKSLNKELSPIDFCGLIVPVTTPFTDSNMIDKENFICHLDFLRNHGVKRILVNGTTGEFFSLSAGEQKLLLSIARQYFPGLVLFHTGTSNLNQTIEALKYSDQFGADAIVISAPYYLSNLSEDGLIKYFSCIAESANIPIFLYNFPLYTQNKISPKILQNVPHFALKDSSSDLSLIQYTSKYFIGNDFLITKAYQRGACGFVSGYANVIPDPFVELDILLEKNEKIRAENIQNKIISTIKNLKDKYKDQNSVGIKRLKYVLSEALKEYPKNVRLPLV
ncbi:MAG: dihydrodipicolinate synthase family protein [Verrucomicrobiota bacterium]|nr:dihydrodipicolinate synthase family protein [Verrucomicrobiota bacterium]